MAGYWVIWGDERDADALAEYRRLWQPIGARYGAEIIAGKRAVQFREGRAFDQVFVARFPSFERAVACYEDDAYQRALAHAATVSTNCRFAANRSTRTNLFAGAESQRCQA